MSKLVHISVVIQRLWVSLASGEPIPRGRRGLAEIGRAACSRPSRGAGPRRALCGLVASSARSLGAEGALVAGQSSRLGGLAVAGQVQGRRSSARGPRPQLGAIARPGRPCPGKRPLVTVKSCGRSGRFPSDNHYL